MSDNATQALPIINDSESLLVPSNQTALVRRIKKLSTRQYMTTWMQVEIAAIAVMLDEPIITAGQVWRLVQPHYDIASSVSSVPDPANDPNWLTQPLTDRALVWEHLTALCTDQELAPVPALPGPYANTDTPEAAQLLEQALNFHVVGLNRLRRRFYSLLSGEDFLGRLEYELRHDIEHHLAIQRFGGALAVGASLHALPLPGGSFGLDDQPVYVLKALVEALKRDIADYQDASLVDQDSQLSRELLGRIDLWWAFVKGYTYDMVRTHEGRIVVAMLAGYPELVEDLKMVLTRGFNLITSGRPATPKWGYDGGCEMEQEIGATPTPTLISELEARIVSLEKEKFHL